MKIKTFGLNKFKKNNTIKDLFRIMKISLILLFVFTFQLMAVNTEAQNAVIRLQQNEITVAQLIYEIEKQTDYLVVYSNREIDTNKKFTVSKKSDKVSTYLSEALSESDIEYDFENNYIVLAQKMKQSASIIVDLIKTVQQQGRIITGKITDADDEPIIGANIVEKGMLSNGTVTNYEGEFSLRVGDNATIRISYIGYLDQEIKTSGKTSFNIVLKEDTRALAEVVVVGYGVQKKVNLTGAISSVKTEQLTNMAAANLSNTIAGRAPGIQIIGNTGLAGAASTIRIRGSFGDPLFIINGIQKSRADFDALDPDEVETINFLKDAASASVYGSSAGNGVVLITTKRGANQKPVFAYKSMFSTLRTTKPVQDYTATEEITYVNNISITKGQAKPYGPEIFDYFKDKNYSINDLIWQNPSVQQHNLSVNGGNEAISYYLSLGYHTEEGSYKNLNYDKYNFRSDVTANISKRFKINVNISGNQRNYDRWYWPYDGAENFNVSDFYRATINWTRLYPFYVDAKGNPSQNPRDIPVLPGGGGWHPVELMLNSGGYRKTRYRTLDGLIRFDLDLGQYIDGLSSSFLAQITAQDKNMKSFVPHNKYYVFQPGGTTNKFVSGPVDFSKKGSHNLSSNYENVRESVDLYNSYQYNWFINYRKKFGRHNLSAMIVYEQLGSKGKDIYGRANKLLSSSIDQIFNAASDTKYRWFEGFESQFARQSWIGRTNYAFADKYIAEFSFRYDGNYKFAPNKRWGFFPSFSAAWRISEEKFMKRIQWLSNLKLRGSYGTTGSDSGIGAWRWMDVYKKTKGFVFGNTLLDGLVPSAIPNPDITWSTVTLWNAGLEYGFLNNRLLGEFDVWNKKESDILGTRLGSTPTTFGGNLPAVNYAQRSWKGCDLNIRWKDKFKKLNYEVYANMGYAVDKWDILDEPKALSDGTYKDNWRSRIGKPANRVNGYISKGIIRTQQELDAIPKGFTQFGRAPILGTLLFEDIRGDNYSEGPDGKIDENDKTFLSDNGIPRINYGFGVNLDWKGIILNAHLQGVGAYDKVVSTMNTRAGGVFQIGRPYFELWARDYWTPENPDAKYPRVAGNWLQPEFGGGPSSFWIRNGAYLRLKNLNIAYNLPSSWYKKLGIRRVQVFFNGTNLFVLSEFKEHDPEQLRLDSYPLMKTFTGGLSINF